MEWIDEGIILAVSKHGESSLIASIFTKDHGKHKGLIKGGLSKNNAGITQTGNRVLTRWRARTENHLGNYYLEPIKAFPSEIMRDSKRLAGLCAATALVETSFPECESHTDFYDALTAMIDNISEPNWSEFYVKWELILLSALGYGLDLTKCAATGRNDNLIFVSPKTGRAVSASAGEPYKNKLLPLPQFLCSPQITYNCSKDEIIKGLILTGFFLEKHVFTSFNLKMPAARLRLIDYFYKNAA